MENPARIGMQLGQLGGLSSGGHIFYFFLFFFIFHFSHFSLFAPTHTHQNFSLGRIALILKGRKWSIVTLQGKKGSPLKALRPLRPLTSFHPIDLSRSFIIIYFAMLPFVPTSLSHAKYLSTWALNIFLPSIIIIIRHKVINPLIPSLHHQT